MTSSKLLENCLIDGGKTHRILDFGMHGYADTFIPENLLALTEPVHPLACNLCQDCGHVQVGYLTNDGERYQLYEYSYTSSNSEYAKSHWTSFCDEISNMFDASGPNKVLEIGSNDGYLLSRFTKPNRKLLGIDPSRSVGKSAEELGIEVVYSLFDSKVAEDLLPKYGEFDLIIANNVLNHSNSPVDFLKGIYRMLSAEGRFVFEVPYWGSLVSSRHFDQVYHEHVSYFTLKSIEKLMQLSNLYIEEVGLNPYHGGSLRVIATKVPISIYTEDSKAKKDEILKIELDEDILNLKRYIKLMEDISISKSNFLVRLHKARIDHPNATFIGVGAAAKANTLLTFYGLGSDVIDFITDSSEQKIGKFTPLTRIPIRPDEAILGLEEVFAVILSWNITESLLNRIKKINPKVRILEL